MLGYHVYDQVADAEAETCRHDYVPIWYRQVGQAVAWVDGDDSPVCSFSVTGLHEPAEVDL